MSKPRAKPRKAAPPPASPHPITYLSFVADLPGRGKGRNFWSIAARTGDYGLDCRLGAALGQEAVAYLRRHGAGLLSMVVKDMMAAGTFGGVEIGFLREFDLAVERRRPLPDHEAEHVERIWGAAYKLRAAREADKFAEIAELIQKLALRLPPDGAPAA
jgi:hypothetical protein